MIYTFVQGVTDERFEAIKARVEEDIQLEAASHRDPSEVIPALSNAILQRAFDDPAVLAALEQNRISVLPDVSDDERADVLKQQIGLARRAGSRSLGIFAQSNVSVASIAETLTNVGIDHVLIGIPEAHAQALSAMEMECRYALGLADWDEVALEFALFLSSTVRTGIPQLARDIKNGEELPPLLESAFEALRLSLRDTNFANVAELIEVVCESWQKLPLTGQKSWRRAIAHFRRLARPVLAKPCDEESLALLTRIVDEGRSEALVDRDYSERGAVSLMTFHQTKGREADTVIHVYTERDRFLEPEPFPEASKVLFVALSRARRNVVILLPPQPSGLVAPFGTLL